MRCKIALVLLPFAGVIFLSDAVAQNYVKTENISYSDSPSKWILGLTTRLVVNGVVVDEIAYNNYGQPSEIRKFGKIQQSLTYNADGTLASAKDGGGNVTNMSSWKLGIPQSIKYQNGTTQSADVDDRGWIKSITDENGYVTTYGYDAMGRLASIAYPSDDSATWNITAQAFERVSAAEYGLPAGHWRQTVATGNARKLTYYDALWRPLVTREYDAGNEGGLSASSVLLTTMRDESPSPLTLVAAMHSVPAFGPATMHWVGRPRCPRIPSWAR